MGQMVLTVQNGPNCPNLSNMDQNYQRDFFTKNSTKIIFSRTPLYDSDFGFMDFFPQFQTSQLGKILVYVYFVFERGKPQL